MQEETHEGLAQIAGTSPSYFFYPSIQSEKFYSEKLFILRRQAFRCLPWWRVPPYGKCVNQDQDGLRKAD